MVNRETGKRAAFQKFNLSENLVIYIKEQILEGELDPGDRIVETKIAEELGISQTPVREAMRQLSGEGIVTLVPNRGPVVRPLEMKDVFEIYSIRAGLEGLAIRFAVENASAEDIAELEDFFDQMKAKVDDDTVESLFEDSTYIHQFIVNLSNHSRLIRMYESISFHISLANRILGRNYPKQKEIEQHQEVIDALKQGDPSRAEEVMRRHIYRAYLEFVKYQENGKPRNINEGTAWF